MKERLNEDIKAALLKGDAETVDSLRFLKNSLDGAEKQKGSELTDEEVVGVLRKELKKREEAAELYQKGGNQSSADKEKKEAGLIKSYLPEELSEQEVRTKLSSIIETNSIPKEKTSMGQLMGLARQQLGSSADPSLIAKVANQLLSDGQ